MTAKLSRAGLGIALIVLLVGGLLDGREAGTPLAVTSQTSTTALATALAMDGAFDLVYADSTPPSFRAAVLMASAAAAGSDVTLVVPDHPPALQVTPPAHPVAGRRTALSVTLRGDAGTDALVTIDSENGAQDTVSVPIGASGTARTRIAVEPARSGTMTWVVGALGERLRVHAWVRAASPVRVLVLTGPPEWESRYLVRALEAAGMNVAVHQDLGRAQTVTSGGGFLPQAVPDLTDVDVVAVLGATPVPSDILTEWVADRGGGLLLVGPGAGDVAFPAWSPGRQARSGLTSSLRWGGPAEIVPLPSSEARPLGAATGRGVPVAWLGPDSEAGAMSAPDPSATVYAAADWLGRGRIFTTGFESWGWAMEAGLAAEHREYWESIVEWLAGGLAADFTMNAQPGRVAVAWEGRLEGEGPLQMSVTGTGSSEAERMPELTGPGPERRLRFVPTEVGSYDLSADGGLTFGVPVVDVDLPTTWTDAALEIGGAGGHIVTAASFLPSGPTGSLEGRGARLWLLFLLLAGLAVVGWAHRRINGLT